MNIKHLIAAVAVLSATGSVFAQQNEWVDPAAQFVSSMTRAEVISELKQARAADNYAVAGGEEFAYPGTSFVAANSSRPNATLAAITGKTRADVIAEIKQTRRDDSFVVGGVDFQSPAPAAKNGSARQVVRKEAIAAPRTIKASGLESGY